MTDELTTTDDKAPAAPPAAPAVPPAADEALTPRSSAEPDGTHPDDHYTIEQLITSSHQLLTMADGSPLPDWAAQAAFVDHTGTMTIEAAQRIIDAHQSYRHGPDDR